MCTEICGDGLDFGTLGCEDGNTDAGDGCSATCTVETNYICSGGTSTSVDTCVYSCGEGYNSGENECDDGNNDNGDGCSSVCAIETGFTCSGGSAFGSDTCTQICGDGYITHSLLGSNRCDDENTRSGDGCSSTCYIESGW